MDIQQLLMPEMLPIQQLTPVDGQVPQPQEIPEIPFEQILEGMEIPVEITVDKPIQSPEVPFVPTYVSPIAISVEKVEAQVEKVEAQTVDIPVEFQEIPETITKDIIAIEEVETQQTQPNLENEEVKVEFKEVEFKEEAKPEKTEKEEIVFEATHKSTPPQPLLMQPTPQEAAAPPPAETQEQEIVAIAQKVAPAPIEKPQHEQENEIPLPEQEESQEGPQEELIRFTKRLGHQEPTSTKTTKPFVKSEITVDLLPQMDPAPPPTQAMTTIVPVFQAPPTPAAETVQKMTPESFEISIKTPVLEPLQSHIAKFVPPGETHMTIQLYPEELGQVTVQVDITKEGQSKIHFTTDNVAVRDVLRQYTGEIIQIFEQSNLSLDFSGLGFSSRQEQNQQEDQRQPFQPQPGYLSASEVEKQTPFIATKQTGIDIHV